VSVILGEVHIAESEERRILTERNSVDKPVTVTQCTGQTVGALSEDR